MPLFFTDWLMDWYDTYHDHKTSANESEDIILDLLDLTLRIPSRQFPQINIDPDDANNEQYWHRIPNDFQQNLPRTAIGGPQSSVLRH